MNLQISIQNQRNIAIKLQAKADLKLLENSEISNTPNQKYLYLFDNNKVQVSEKMHAEFFSFFKKSGSEKYARSKVKRILNELTEHFKNGQYSSEASKGSRHIQLRRGNNATVYFKLSEKATVWFNEIARSTGHKANTDRKRLLFALIECVFWQSYIIEEKSIN